MVNIKQKIVVNFQREGIHYFERAAKDPIYEDVKFLGYPHRHIFHFTVKIDVVHDDRDIEFIQFKRFCQSLFDDNVININGMSCEQLAKNLFEKIAEKYPNRNMEIHVFEDGENGAELIFEY